MGCRRNFSANRLEVLLDEDDSRSSSRAREHGSFSACFTTACGNPDTLKSMSTSSLLCQQADGLSTHRSPRACVGAFAAKQDIFFDLLSKQIRWLLTLHKSLRAWKLGFWSWLGLLEVFTTSSNFWTRFFHPNIFKENLWRRSRWRIHFLVYDFSSFHQNSFRDTTSWECVVKDDCVRSCLIELESFLLSKFYVDPIHRVFIVLPLFLLVPCKTQCFQVNVIRISVFFVHRIQIRKEYRLSFAQNLSSRYQSWIDDGM